jgi:GT2 family glycosyltransferase
MNVPTPRAAIIIPTRNRRESLARTLDAVDRQTCSPDAFEVVVVANACTDDTAAFVTARRDAVRYPLRLIDRPEPGAAAARNAGAGRTRASLLVFLDDDIEPQPGFVEAHVEAHRRNGGERSVGIGYLPAILQPHGDLFAVTLRAWWEAMFDAMRSPGHRFKYTDLLSGNFSVPRDLFLSVGGFNPRYRCHEDYEIGYRLIRAGAEFMFVEAASGTHADHTRIERACGRKREEGYADVQLAQQHPELRTALLLARAQTRKQRLLRWAAFHAPRVGDAAAQTLMDMLPAVERLGFRMAWLRVLYGVFGYWYARGLADALPRSIEVDRLMDGAWEERAERDDARLPVPLDAGVDAAERLLDENRPMAASLTLEGRPFGELAYQPGAEALAGRHLRQNLITCLHREYVEALIAAQRLDILSSATPSPTPAGPGEPAPRVEPAMRDTPSA